MAGLVVLQFDYFGFKTLERSYLLKIGGKVGLSRYSLPFISIGIFCDKWKQF